MKKNNNTADEAYALSQLEVFNWGPFSGFHRIHFDPDGCSLIGQTGSGKTTLVDAIMTLLCALPKYNLASTGGHESDRSLISYIRGVSGSGGDNESSHIARPGQTKTGLSIELSSKDKIIRLTGLLWIDSTSTSQTDMKRLWIFDQNNHQSLGDYLQQLQEMGARALKIQLKEQQDLLVTDNKKAYLSQCRRFFEVGENAFVLLNRAAGLKQLNSIDTLFRELVLDDRSAFKRAAEVANEFDELQGIHAELQIARQQQQSLLPIESNYKKHQKITQKLQQLKKQYHLLAQWFAHYACLFWSQRAEQNTQAVKQYELDLLQQQQQQDKQQIIVNESYQHYQQIGGADIESLKHQLEETQQQKLLLQQNIQDYQQLCQAIKLDNTISSAQLVKNQQIAHSKISQLSEQLNELELSRDQKTQETLNAEEQTHGLEQEIIEVEATPDNNIPAHFLRFQQQLAIQLQINNNEIPYIAQCIEIQDTSWQGAIERAIGSHRLRLVIDAEHMQTALQWINQRNNNLHVRLLNSADYQISATTQMNDGFCHKLKIKNNQHQSVIQHFLNSIDRHCVNTTIELHNTAYGMTQEGLMSGKRGLFEKQDQKPLTQGWLTGFDNHARLNELKQQFQQLYSQASHLRTELEVIKDSQKLLMQQQDLFNNLQHLQFSEIDIKGSTQILMQLEEQLKSLLDPQSDAARAEQLWHSATQQFEKLQANINNINVRLKLAQAEFKRAAAFLQQAKKRIKEPLSPQQLDYMASYYTIPKAEQLEILPDIEREQNHKLQQKISLQDKQSNELQVRLGKFMVKAQKEDTGALNEVGTEMEDIPAYLERLSLLTKEALPAKLERFLHYLNTSSDQGVTQLLTRIDNEVSIIEERIEELNNTMKEVDFQPDCYLQLVPQKVTHESLQSLQRAQRDMRSAALLDDQGEAHYHALLVLIKQLREAVERKRTRPALALLDPRYRLQFSVAIINRKNKHILETRTGSQGGSGGEKEIIASYILTASLSYALCPQHRNTPLFASVILDEAFSKSSQAVAARIIAALTQFGLHPLFVTPNKEMRLLRNHTSSAVLVHRQQKNSRAISLSWREIDKYINQRQEV